MKTQVELMQFIAQIKCLDRIVIQAHDFPDHDAISASFALAYLFECYGIKSLIVYNGMIDRISLSNMIQWLQIPAYHIDEVNLTEHDKIITVDGCIGEKNVMDLPGDEIAVIDHHQVKAPEGLWFKDVRPSYGATATIINEYYQLLNVLPPEKIATSLLVGLNIDTANLTRSVTPFDIEAFTQLNDQASVDIVTRICRNSIEHHELALYELATTKVQVDKGVAYLFIDLPCPKNMLGIIGDFLLTVNEIDIVLVATKTQQNMQISLRSECEKVDVADVARKVLNDNSWGFGGGHAHMAGGIIMNDHHHHFMSNNTPTFKPFIDKFKAIRGDDWRYKYK